MAEKYAALFGCRIVFKGGTETKNGVLMNVTLDTVCGRKRVVANKGTKLFDIFDKLFIGEIVDVKYSGERNNPWTKEDTTTGLEVTQDQWELNDVEILDAHEDSAMPIPSMLEGRTGNTVIKAAKNKTSAATVTVVSGDELPPETM